jgi:hypothetical protein
MEIELINNIVCEAVKHGADAGGSYDSNSYGLTVALQRYLDFKGISDTFGVSEMRIGCQRIPQIVETYKIF